MAIVLKVQNAPSQVANYPFLASVRGYSGSITTLRLVVGIDNGGTPATFGDLTVPVTYGAWHEMTAFTWLRSAGINQATAEDDGFPNGAVGDQLWWALVNSGGVPGPTDPLIAVDGPYIVGI